MTIIVNLFAGPGSGKSTTAAGVFYHLKRKNINCELVREYAKELVWEKSFEKLKDQGHVTLEQQHRVNILKPYVDVIVTDSPPRS